MLGKTIVTIGIILLIASPLHAALAYDADTGVTGTGTLNISHTPVGTPSCALLFVSELGNSDGANVATYGGAAMAEIPTSSPLTKATGETANVSVFWIGSSIPTGAQTVSTTVTNANNKRAQVYTFTGAADCEIVNSATLSADAVANPSTSLTLGGRTSLVMIGGVSGQDAPANTSPTSGWTDQGEFDLGTQSVFGYTYDTVSSSDVTVGWTQTSEDAVAIAVAISEVVAASSGTGRSLLGFIGR